MEKHILYEIITKELFIIYVDVDINIELCFLLNYFNDFGCLGFILMYSYVFFG
jgi:hypothetical protein